LTDALDLQIQAQADARPGAPACDGAVARWRGRVRYTAAWEHRSTRWRPRGVARSRAQQEAQWQALRAELPDFAASHRQPPPGRAGGPGAARHDL